MKLLACFRPRAPPIRQCSESSLPVAHPRPIVPDSSPAAPSLAGAAAPAGCHVWMPPTSSEEANSGPQPAAAAAGFNLARSEPQDQQLHFNKTSDASSAQHEADQGPSIPAHPAASTPVRGAAMKKTASYVSIAHWVEEHAASQVAHSHAEWDVQVTSAKQEISDGSNTDDAETDAVVSVDSPMAHAMRHRLIRMSRPEVNIGPMLPDLDHDPIKPLKVDSHHTSSHSRLLIHNPSSDLSNPFLQAVLPSVAAFARQASTPLESEGHSQPLRRVLLGGKAAPGLSGMHRCVSASALAQLAAQGNPALNTCPEAQLWHLQQKLQQLQQRQGVSSLRHSTLSQQPDLEGMQQQQLEEDMVPQKAEHEQEHAPSALHRQSRPGSHGAEAMALPSLNLHAGAAVHQQQLLGSVSASTPRLGQPPSGRSQDHSHPLGRVFGGSLDTWVEVLERDDADRGSDQHMRTRVGTASLQVAGAGDAALSYVPAAFPGGQQGVPLTHPHSPAMLDLVAAGGPTYLSSFPTAVVPGLQGPHSPEYHRHMSAGMSPRHVQLMHPYSPVGRSNTMTSGDGHSVAPPALRHDKQRRRMRRAAGLSTGAGSHSSPRAAPSRSKSVIGSKALLGGLARGVDSGSHAHHSGSNAGFAPALSSTLGDHFTASQLSENLGSLLPTQSLPSPINRPSLNGVVPPSEGSTLLTEVWPKVHLSDLEQYSSFQLPAPTSRSLFGTEHIAGDEGNDTSSVVDAAARLVLHSPVMVDKQPDAHPTASAPTAASPPEGSYAPSLAPTHAPSTTSTGTTSLMPAGSVTSKHGSSRLGVLMKQAFGTAVPDSLDTGTHGRGAQPPVQQGLLNVQQQHAPGLYGRASAPLPAVQHPLEVLSGSGKLGPAGPAVGPLDSTSPAVGHTAVSPLPSCSEILNLDVQPSPRMPSRAPSHIHGIPSYAVLGGAGSTPGHPGHYYDGRLSIGSVMQLDVQLSPVGHPFTPSRCRDASPAAAVTQVGADAEGGVALKLL